MSTQAAPVAEAQSVQAEAPKAQPAQLSPQEPLKSDKDPSKADKEPSKEIKEPKEDLNYSSKFAALSRREKQILERERKFKEQEASYKQQLEKVNGWELRKSEFKKNPDLIFEELGLSFDDIVNFKLGITPEEKKEDPNSNYAKLEKEMREEIQKLKEERENEKKSKEIDKAAQDAQIIDGLKSEIESTIISQADKYELINYQGNYELVFDVIDEYFTKHGELLSIEAAADHVESYLEGLVEGVTKLKKFSTKLAPKSEPQRPVEEAPKPEAVKDSKPKTLSNNLNASTPSSAFKSPIHDIEESKKKAASLLRWS